MVLKKASAERMMLKTAYYIKDGAKESCESHLVQIAWC